MSAQTSVEVFGPDEEYRLRHIVGPWSKVIKAFAMHSNGLDFNAVIYIQLNSNDEKYVYLAQGVQRQSFLWEKINPTLDKTCEGDLAFIAHGWNIETSQLHDLILTNHPW